MSRRHSTRCQSRRSLLWRVFYGIEELAGEGSVLDMHETGCRIAGCMPVETGMRLRLCLWPGENPKDIVVARGSVKWTRGLQFGVALERPVRQVDKPNGDSLHLKLNQTSILP